MARVVETTDERGYRVVEVALSERNLLVLLSKLYTPGSTRTVMSGDVPGGFAFARICAEDDEEHYASPTREGAPAGEMHPVAEAVLDEIRAIFGVGQRIRDDAPREARANG
jgi:hypothetical protein